MKKLVLVDTISQHRIRYVVEVEDDIDHALDEIVMNDYNSEFKEFSQEHLGQVIVSHREITKEEYLKTFDQDNDYLTSWSSEQKLNFINKINYGEENDFTNSGNET
jgi:hypothetical protein